MIKEHTQNSDSSTNTQVNLIAHAVLGAVEAYATGNNAAAGAIAGAGGEAAAMAITSTLYPDKKPNELTEAEKQNVVFLSQLASGLASGVVGDSSLEATTGADIGKRAVENNFLAPEKAKERFDIENRIKLGIATEEDIARKAALDAEDVANNKKVDDACSSDVTSHGCQSAVAEAQLIRDGYSALYPNSYIQNYSQVLAEDYQRFNELLYDKEGMALDFEVRARLVSKGKNIPIEEARSFVKLLDRYHMAYVGIWGAKQLATVKSTGKSLEELGDFTKKVPDEINSTTKQVEVGKTVGYENQTVKLSTEAENIVLYPKLKDQLIQENLRNIVNKNPVLEHVAYKDGNFTTKGIFTKEEINKLALEWVGDGAVRNSDGGLLSADGTRRYRPPKEKTHSIYAETGIQANFERGYINSKGKFVADSNLHLNIGDKK